MTVDTVIFFISAVVAVFGATMMITQRNPIAAVMYLILSLVAQAVCYVQLGALFMGAILVIVYAGAIMVLFLFVIMLLNLRGGEDLGETSKPVNTFTKYVISALLLAELLFVIKGVAFPGASTGIMNQAQDSFGDITTVATLLFTDYLYAFELTGVLLLVAVVGAVVLAKRDPDEEPPAVVETTDASVTEGKSDEVTR